MTFSEIKQKLPESEASLRRWINILKKNGVIAPRKGPGNEDIFSEEDFAKIVQAIDLGKRGLSRPQVAAFLKGGYAPDAKVFVRLREEHSTMLRTLIDMAFLLRRCFFASLPQRLWWALRPKTSPQHEAMAKLLQFLESRR